MESNIFCSLCNFTHLSIKIFVSTENPVLWLMWFFPPIWSNISKERQWDFFSSIKNSVFVKLLQHSFSLVLCYFRVSATVLSFLACVRLNLGFSYSFAKLIGLLLFSFCSLATTLIILSPVLVLDFSYWLAFFSFLLVFCLFGLILAFLCLF